MAGALKAVKTQEKKSELNRLIDEWIFENLDEEVKLLDAIETMKSTDLNAAISQVAKMKSSKIVGGNNLLEQRPVDKVPTTQNVIVKGYESLRDKEESGDINLNSPSIEYENDAKK